MGASDASDAIETSQQVDDFHPNQHIASEHIGTGPDIKEAIASKDANNCPRIC
jgi:hypothetical protein